MFPKTSQNSHILQARPSTWSSIVLKCSTQGFLQRYLTFPKPHCFLIIFRKYIKSVKTPILPRDMGDFHDSLDFRSISFKPLLNLLQNETNVPIASACLCSPFRNMYDIYKHLDDINRIWM